MNVSTQRLQTSLPRLVEALSKAIAAAAGEPLAFTLLIYTPEQAQVINTSADRMGVADALKRAGERMREAVASEAKA